MVAYYVTQAAASATLQHAYYTVLPFVTETLSLNYNCTAEASDKSRATLTVFCQMHVKEIMQEGFIN